MFKFVKILSSGTNTPDCYRVKTTQDTAYKAGTLLSENLNCAVNLKSGTEKPAYLAMETLAPNEKEYILVCPITPEMIFEAEVTGYGAEYLSIGKKVCVAIDDEGFAYAITTITTDGVACVVYPYDSKSTGNKARVKFN